MTDSSTTFDLQGWKSRIASGRDELCSLQGDSAPFAAMLDELLQALGRRAGWDHFGCALLALGGYGRAEMAPHSDVDLLFLVRRDSDAGAIDEVLYPLWDLGFEVGHALRTPSDCAAMAAKDLTVATAFLDGRQLLGDVGLVEKARKKVGIRVGGSREMRRWVPKILEDVETRRAHFGEVSHLLEPHIKEGRGGLRDLQACRWVLRCLALDPPAYMGPDTGGTDLGGAVRFLHSCRNALHLVAGRKTDHLTFDFHRDVAERVLPGKNLAQFFERLHRASHRIAAAWDNVAAVARQELLPARKRTSTTLPPAAAGPITAEVLGWCRDGGEFPEELRLALAGGAPEVLREALTAAAAHILRSRTPLAPLLYQLHAQGRLELVVPELAAVAHQVTYDARHAFTTGVHCLESLRAFENLWLGNYEKREPHLTRIAGGVLHPGAARLAALCHDLGKANGVAEHEQRGASVARDLAHRLGLDDQEAEEAARLVQNHHVIASIAFGEDLEDPASWQRALAAAGSNAGLDALVSLAFADLVATNPDSWSGVWSDWKRDLLLCLHARARDPDPQGLLRGARLREAVMEAASAQELGAVEASWHQVPQRQAEQMPPDLLARLLVLSAALGEAPAKWHVEGNGAGMLEILGVVAPLPRVLSATTTTLTLMGMDVLSFQVHAWPDGTHHMWFRVVAPPSAAGTSASELARRLADSVTGGAQQGPSEPAPLVNRRAEAVPVQTRVRVLPGDSPFYTVLEIRCRDRKGLIRDLARLFENLGLTVEYALVTTHGPMAQDTFHLKDIFGGRVDGAAKLQALVKGAEEVAQYAV